jgi:hypothetical protein
MTRRLAPLALIVATGAVALAADAPSTSPATTRASGVVEFPGVTVDLSRRQVRVACEALAVDAPLEFFCVAKGGPEHETVLRTPARPSHVHAGLLLLGLEPGEPAHYDEAGRKWVAPRGPAVRITCEWTAADGRVVREPAARLMRGARDRATTMPADTTWVFAGSRVRAADDAYLADPLGYVVAIVNFEHAPIDVPRLASNANETLEWARDERVAPPRGTSVTMILEPAHAR